MIEIDGETYDISRDDLQTVADLDGPFSELAQWVLENDERTDTAMSNRRASA